MTLVMFPEEDDWMMFVGHLQERCPEQPACKLVVGPGVSGSALSENLKLMFLFRRLQHLELSFSDEHYTYDQRCVASLAELLQLTSLHITGARRGRAGAGRGPLPCPLVRMTPDHRPDACDA